MSLIEGKHFGRSKLTGAAYSLPGGVPHLATPRHFSERVSLYDSANVHPLGMKMLFRPHPSPAFPMPMGVRSTGIHVPRQGWMENRPKKVCIFLWCTHGRGKLWLGDKTFALLPEQVVVYLEEDVHHWQAVTDDWRYRWFTLDGAVADACLRSFNFPRNPVNVGPCPENLFEILYSLVGDPHPGSEYLASVYAYHILAFACSHLDSTREVLLPDRIKSALETNFSDPDFGIDQLAAELQLHRSTIIRSFTNHFRVTPRKYLINMRLQFALGLLLESKLSIADVAHQSGFRDVAYFTRSINRTFGVPPSLLRKRGF